MATTNTEHEGTFVQTSTVHAYATPVTPGREQKQYGTNTEAAAVEPCLEQGTRCSKYIYRTIIIDNHK